MNLLECLASAFSSIVSNKMRSVLTMIGIIIGISSVIMIVSAGQGVTNGITKTFDEMGMNMIEIYMMQSATRERDFLTVEDVDLLREHPAVDGIAPLIYWYTAAEAKNSEETQYIYMRGTTQDYMDIQNIELLEGRFLIEADLKSKLPVIVIEENLAYSVYGRTDVIGETFIVNTWRGNTELTVVGVYKSQNLEGAMNFLFSMPLTAYVPISFMEVEYSQYYLDYIGVTLHDASNMDQVALELTKMLEIKHQNKDMYYAQNTVNMLDEVNSIMGLITVFIGFVAAISLLVGGIGVMNIMLVTVTERTREIGIRKSLGATNRNICVQFMVEAMIITAIGGIIGILLGYAGGIGIGGLISVEASIPVAVVIGATLTSCVIGVVFGVYPAIKAASLNPIEALRYE